MSRKITLRRLANLCDIAVAALAFLAAYITAYGSISAVDAGGVLIKTFAFAAVSGIMFWVFGLTRGSWRYVSIPDVISIIKASLFAIAIYTIGAFLLFRGDNIPRSVPVLTFFFQVVGLSAARLAYRLSLERAELFPAISNSRRPGGTRQVLLLGLSDHAESFIRAVNRQQNSNINVVGILDDSHINEARAVRGVRVVGAFNDLEAILRRLAAGRKQVTEIIVTEDMPDRRRLGVIVEKATACGLKISKIPDHTQPATLTNGTVFELKPIELEDLLGRPEVHTDIDGVARLIKGCRVLATGAGGSIGSELCRQIATFGPDQLIITDSSEFHLYMLDKELRETHPNLTIVTRIANVRDEGRINQLFAQFKPNVVFHAAALKHVPLVEDNPVEGVKTNVVGTCNVANAAVANGTSTFVMISTDKAVNPTNIMGATKRAAEAYCQSLDVGSPHTRFKTVRFGNVLGSNGSVVPRFQEQIATGGPVNVTHPHMVRFFMTIPEAVRLVLHASAQAMGRPTERGKIMVLDMGEPVKIVDLAERMIQLAGFKPHIDIDIVFTGLRPGEKLYEELFDPTEIQDGRTEQGYVIAAPRVIDQALLERTLKGLTEAVERNDVERSIDLLSHIVPEYRREYTDPTQPVSETVMKKP